MHREQFRKYLDFFGGEIEITAGTVSTEMSLPGPIDVYQLQFDTVSTELTATSLRVTIDGAVVKNRSLPAQAGTAEVSFVGRRIRATNQVFIDRVDGDNHAVYWSLIYRPAVTDGNP
jgi:hypothetical protein